jgi:hypothetical protein
MLGVEAARLAYTSGSGLIGAGLVGLVAGVAAYGLLVALFIAVRPPILRLAVALAYAAPAAVAGYTLVHGIIGGIFVGVSEQTRLAAAIPSKKT